MLYTETKTNGPNKEAQTAGMYSILLATHNSLPRELKGVVLFVEHGEIRPSLNYKIILHVEQREERNQLNSCRKEQLVICSRKFWKQKAKKR